MGIFESLKRTFNIGGVDLTLGLDEPVHRQGEAVRGVVRATGGGYRHEATSLRVELVEFWTERRGSGKNRRTVTVTRTEASLELASPFAIEPGESAEFAFDVVLPVDGRLSEPNGATGWMLAVTMDVPNAVDPTRNEKLRVEPAPALEELVAIWQRDLRWQEQPGHRGWDRSTRATTFRLVPPEEVRVLFDHVDLACRREGSDWLVALAFDLQEQSLGDRLKALIDIDKAKDQLRIPAAHLDPADADGRRATILALATMMQAIEARRRA